MVGFLVGCAPGLTATRVEGISQYTNATNKVAEVEQMVKTQADPAFLNTPGWKQIDGRNQVALIDLKYALTHHDEAEVVSAGKETQTALSLLAMNHLGALYSAYQITTSRLPAYEQDLKRYGLDKDAAWVAARNHLTSVLKQLAAAAVTTDEELLKNRATEANAAHGEVIGIYQKLVTAARTKEACSHVRCPGTATCKYQWGQVACLDEKTPESVDSLNKGPVASPDDAQ